MTSIRAMALVLVLVAIGASPAEAATIPAKPTGLRLSVAATSMNVSWPAVKNATSYRVCLKTSTTSSCFRLSDRSSKRSFTFTRLTPTPGIDYYAMVNAYRGSQHRSSDLVGFDLPVGTVSGLEAAAWTPTTLPAASSERVKTDEYQRGPIGISA